MLVRRMWSSRPKADGFRIDNQSSSRTAKARDGESGLFPQLDITQDDEHVYVRMELPGIRPDEISISAFRHSMSFIGKHPARSDSERPEVGQRSFSCTLALPSEVDADPIDAGYCDGVLTVTLCKRVSASRSERQRCAPEPSVASP